MKSSFSFVTAGQCLVKKDLSSVRDAGFQRIVEMIRGADLAFTNFEGAILGESCWPTKEAFCSAVSPSVLDGLKTMGFDALSLANNHAFDLGAGGILAGQKEVQKRGFHYAGTGKDFAEASCAGFRDYPFGRVALVAIHAAGAVESAYCSALDAREEQGLPARPGVNVIRVVACPDGQGGVQEDFLEEDRLRHLNAIREAASSADFVIVYLHIHVSPVAVPAHYRLFARQCIDAGANILVGHGNPVFYGVEVYRNRPLFYNMSNLVFHSYNTEYWYERHGNQPWESLLARIQFGMNGDMTRMELQPVLLGDPQQLMQSDLNERCSSYPVPASGKSAEEILQRLVTRSSELGTALHEYGSLCDFGP